MPARYTPDRWDHQYYQNSKNPPKRWYCPTTPHSPAGRDLREQWGGRFIFIRIMYTTFKSLWSSWWRFSLLKWEPQEYQNLLDYQIDLKTKLGVRGGNKGKLCERGWLGLEPEYIARVKKNQLDTLYRPGIDGVGDSWYSCWKNNVTTELSE